MTLLAQDIHILGDFTISTKERSHPLMVADFLAHSYMMLRNSGEIIGNPGDGNDADMNRNARLLHLFLQPDAIADLKTRLQRDRWLRQAYQKRLKAGVSSPRIEE